MDTILVVGIETVAGANIAAALADRHCVIGLATGSPVMIAGCRTAVCCQEDYETARDWIVTEQPDRVVYCGKAARSTWEFQGPPVLESRDVDAARHWAQAAGEAGCHLTVISSDAVFTGPWMFHAEDSANFCSSEAAGTIREIERVAAESCCQTLIVRTNAFGWTPETVEPGWIETILAMLESQTEASFDSLTHATPILATDLARILESAFERDLVGVYHIGGTERISPAGFVERLAEFFGLPAPQPAPEQSLSQRPTGFGRGETSLLTKRTRRALGVSLPMLDDGLGRLFQQKHNGHCEQLNATTAVSPAHERVT